MADQNPGGTGRLRERRIARMFTQAQVAERLEQLAWLEHRRRVGINADMVSKWERGLKRPSPFYRKLLCELFGAGPEEFDFAGPNGEVAAAAVSVVQTPMAVGLLDVLGTGVEVLHASLFAFWREDMLNRRQLLVTLGLTPAAVGLGSLDVALGLGEPAVQTFRGHETVAALEEVAQRLEASYHRARPESLLLPAGALADTAERYIVGSRSPRFRRPLLGIVARGQLLAGRLSFFDLHRPMEARAHLDLAREAAVESQDSLLAAAALGHMAFLPAEQHQLAAASAYIEGARAGVSSVRGRPIVGWLGAVESEVRAEAGEHHAARLALEVAGEFLDTSTSDALPVWFDFYDSTRFLGFEGFAMRRAGDLDAARRSLESALAPNQIQIPKQRAVMMLDLGSVCADQGDVDRGCALATDAVVALREAGYATAVARLKEFRAALPDTRHPAARLLDEAVADLS
jgi:transcriptional regulator with XRE-family HTH domain